MSTTVIILFGITMSLLLIALSALINGAERFLLSSHAIGPKDKDAVLGYLYRARSNRTLCAMALVLTILLALISQQMM